MSEANANPAEQAEPGQAVTDAMRRWAHRSAADYLGKQATSTANLQKVMRRRAGRRFPEAGKAIAAALADEAVAFCLKHAFVDDTAYAAAKVRSGVRKGQSRPRIAASLAAKGVDRETADDFLAGMDELAAAVAFARRRRFGPWRAALLDVDQRRKEAGAFGRSGFSSGVAAAVMAMSVEAAEDVLVAAAQAG